LIFRVLSLFFSFFTIFDSFAQVTVTGKVTSQNDNQPIIGATILQKGTQTGAKTEADGKFSISVDPNATLVVSFVGFATQEVLVNGRSTLYIEL